MWWAIDYGYMYREFVNHRSGGKQSLVCHFRGSGPKWSNEQSNTRCLYWFDKSPFSSNGSKNLIAHLLASTEAIAYVGSICSSLSVLASLRCSTGTKRQAPSKACIGWNVSGWHRHQSSILKDINGVIYTKYLSSKFPERWRKCHVLR